MKQILGNTPPPVRRSRTPPPIAVITIIQDERDVYSNTDCTKLITTVRSSALRQIAMGLWKSKYPTLDSANKMTKTLNGNVINSKTKYRFVTKRDMEDIARDTNTNDQIRVIISPPFSDFTQVKPNLYMTSIGGMVRENINTNHIKVIISVTHEAPKYWVRGIHFVRIPVSRWPD